jgi:ELWxxDGT repeat protein
MVYNFGSADFVESFLMQAGSNFYIMIASSISGVRQNTIWKSDGTATGTVPVKLIGTGNTNTYPPFAAIGSTLYFAGVDAMEKNCGDGTVQEHSE